MGFFWKFTRSGKYSHSYVSLIIDVDPICVNEDSKIWETSFEELGMVMLLLHDVEVLNQPELGATKPAFKDVVQSLGYKPTLKYRQLRHKLGLVCGQCIMGRHSGVGLDWGRFSMTETPIKLAIQGLQVACYINASDGRLYGSEDKLLCYRQHQDFSKSGMYYDLMPKHTVMNPIMRALLEEDFERADKFAQKWLKWKKE